MYGTKLLAEHSPELCPDTIELNGSVILLGSYFLDKETGNKTGKLGILRLTNADEHEPATVSWRQETDMSCRAVFDAKWASGASDTSFIASATAEGANVDLIEFTSDDGDADSPKLSCVGSSQLAPDNPDVSALSLDWTSTHGTADECDSSHLANLAVSRSDGRISLCSFEDGHAKEVACWAAHNLCGSPIEVWMVACNRRWDANVVWSGGDDGTLKGWDLRAAGSEFTRPLFSSTEHGAGVTCISWHPHVPHLAATGSYDERVLLWDDRAIKRGPIADFATGGGVWRLRWHPDPRRPDLLAAACMYNGAHLLQVDGLAGWSADPASGSSDSMPDVGGMHRVVHHTGHASITYGIEWMGPSALPSAWRPASSTLSAGDDAYALASCSFYDKTVHLWEPSDERATGSGGE